MWPFSPVILSHALPVSFSISLCFSLSYRNTHTRTHTQTVSCKHWGCRVHFSNLRLSLYREQWSWEKHRDECKLKREQNKVAHSGLNHVLFTTVAVRKRTGLIVRFSGTQHISHPAPSQAITRWPISVSPHGESLGLKPSPLSKPSRPCSAP